MLVTEPQISKACLTFKKYEFEKASSALLFFARAVYDSRITIMTVQRPRRSITVVDSIFGALSGINFT
jgi:hypothetical protein